MKCKTKQQQHLEASRKPVSNLSYENISWKIEKKNKKTVFSLKRTKKISQKKLGGAQYSALKIILVIYVYLTPKHVKL